MFRDDIHLIVIKLHLVIEGSQNGKGPHVET